MATIRESFDGTRDRLRALDLSAIADAYMAQH
jgi:hypothetical protein